MGPAARTIDDQVLAVADLAGQATGDHPPHSMGGEGTQILEHDLARIGGAVAFVPRPVRGHDDVAAFALAGNAVAVATDQRGDRSAGPVDGCRHPRGTALGALSAA